VILQPAPPQRFAFPATRWRSRRFTPVSDDPVGLLRHGVWRGVGWFFSSDSEIAACTLILKSLGTPPTTVDKMARIVACRPPSLYYLGKYIIT